MVVLLCDCSECSCNVFFMWHVDAQPHVEIKRTYWWSSCARMEETGRVEPIHPSSVETTWLCHQQQNTAHNQLHLHATTRQNCSRSPPTYRETFLKDLETALFLKWLNMPQKSKKKTAAFIFSFSKIQSQLHSFLLHSCFLGDCHGNGHHAGRLSSGGTHALSFICDLQHTQIIRSHYWCR